MTNLTRLFVCYLLCVFACSNGEKHNNDVFDAGDAQNKSDADPSCGLQMNQADCERDGCGWARVIPITQEKDICSVGEDAAMFCVPNNGTTSPEIYINNNTGMAVISPHGYGPDGWLGWSRCSGEAICVCINCYESPPGRCDPPLP